MLNNQRAEKQDHRLDGSLQVNSIFYTIQGEGPFAGRPAVFVRLAGCNLQCPMCDTEYTGRSTLHYETVVSFVINKSLEMKPDGGFPLVVITGGEPFRQNLGPLTRLLLAKGFEVQVETNGTLFQELPREVHIICSPKTGSVHPMLFPKIKAFKYVLQEGQVAEDGLPVTALAHASGGEVAKPRPGALVYVQPADESGDILANRRNLEAAIKSAKENNHILCIQVHKIIGVE